MQQALVAFDFQEFVEKRLKIGHSQYLTLLTLGLVQMNDGIQAITSMHINIIVSLLTPILKQQLGLNESQVSFLTSAFYIGVGVGALISGIQSNKHGRKKALLFGTLIQFISSLFLAFNISYLWICLCRLFYGIGFGSTLAVATVIITELMPIKLRGKTLLIVNFINSIGKLGGVAVAFMFIDGKEKYISQYMLSSAVLSLISVFLVCFIVKESFRYLLLKKNHEQTWKVMNQTINQNDQSGQQLSNIQKEQITQWSLTVFNSKQQTQNPLKLLAPYKKVVTLLSVSWFFINIIFFGEMFIIPFILKVKENGLTQYFWMTLGQIPTLLLTYTLIDRNGWGRKTSLISFYLGSGVFCLITIWFLNSTTLFLTKMLMKAIFQMLYPFTSESYSTSVRSIGFALNSFFGRVGATLMPFLIYPLYNRYPNSPFLFLAFLCFLGALAIKKIPKDTRQKPLDEIDLAKSTKKDYLNQSSEPNQQQIQLSTAPEVE